MFIVFYVVQFFFPGWYRERGQAAYICETCATVQSATDTATCACGGHLEPLRNYLWQEDVIKRT
jgi:ribosomal protein L37E